MEWITFKPCFFSSRHRLLLLGEDFHQELDLVCLLGDHTLQFLDAFEVGVEFLDSFLVLEQLIPSFDVSSLRARVGGVPGLVTWSLDGRTPSSCQWDRHRDASMLDGWFVIG